MTPKRRNGELTRPAGATKSHPRSTPAELNGVLLGCTAVLGSGPWRRAAAAGPRLMILVATTGILTWEAVSPGAPLRFVASIGHLARHWVGISDSSTPPRQHRGPDLARLADGS